MTLDRRTPPQIHPPLANYCHAVQVRGPATLLFCSGQLALAPDGSIPEDAGDQADLIFANIEAILADAGYAKDDVVRINAFVSAPDYLKPYMAARDRFLTGEPPASTLMVVAGFSRPEFKVEIEIVAAKGGSGPGAD
jgi:enamine deaminase RidA (YjgF/YER057c/UK114 family)